MTTRRLLFVVALLCSVAVAVPAPGWAAPPEIPGVFLPPPVFRFAAFGDFQCGETTVIAGIGSKVAKAPAFVLSTGDLAYGCWNKFMTAAQFLNAQKNNLHVAPGNNDALDELASKLKLPAEFTTSKPYYHFNYGNTLFLMLHSSSSFPPKSATVNCKGTLASQTDWVYCQLQSAAASARVKHVIVAVHEPPFTFPGTDPGEHQGNADLAANLAPLLARATKVRLVLSGHNHFYQHIIKSFPMKPLLQPHVIHYLVMGGGGASLYNLPDPKPAGVHLQEKTHHLVVVTVDPCAVTVQVLRENSGNFEEIEMFAVY